ncbi:alphaherpesvirus glycoprotein E domain protein [Ceratobasidium sp. AG-Ba]|nr:alphaherpesvirus glycoprotein E domain protein [Ceratobasidium sp. AG-Ba]QRW12611.1 alphaherpesvirus glycoprotein E domain protein [Ceratobasidium sp. AG-Ba]
MKPRYSSILLALGTLCRAWRATFSDATQCEDMTITWAGTGGEQLGPPFVVRLAAFGLAPLTVSIPTAAWSDATQSGSYKLNIPWPAGTKFVAAMDDGFGSGTGGVTGIQTVNSSSNSSCITSAITQPDHVFDVLGTFIQCSVVTMNWTEPATSSTLITGLVPNGIAFQLDPPVRNSKSTTWNLNIREGTAFVLVYVPPSGPGLASSLLVSQKGGDEACLSSGAYPSVTASQTGVSQVTSTATSSAPVSPTSSPSSGASRTNSPNLGAIIGATLGAVAFLLALLALAFCLHRRKHRFARVRAGSPTLGKEINLESNDGGLGHDMTTHQRNLPEGMVVLPFVLPGTSSTQACLHFKRLTWCFLRSPPLSSLAYHSQTRFPILSNAITQPLLLTGFDFVETPTSTTRKQPPPSQTRSGVGRQMSRETFTTAESSSGPGTSSGRRDRSNTGDSEPMIIQHADGGSVPMQPRPREVIELPPNYDQLPRSLPRQPAVDDQVRSQGGSQWKI